MRTTTTARPRHRKHSPRWLVPVLALATVLTGVLAIGGTPFAFFLFIPCFIAATIAAAYR
jgi:hypothetical protein